MVRKEEKSFLITNHSRTSKNKTRASFSFLWGSRKICQNFKFSYQLRGEMRHPTCYKWRFSNHNSSNGNQETFAKPKPFSAFHAWMIFQTCCAEGFCAARFFGWVLVAGCRMVIFFGITMVTWKNGMFLWWKSCCSKWRNFFEQL